MAITDGAGVELQPLIRPGWWDWAEHSAIIRPPASFEAAIVSAVPAGPQVRFLDVSHWQNDRGRIDYAQVKRAGYVAVVAKLTEGTSFKDPWGVWNVTEAAKHGLVAGGYHFLRGGQSVAAQFAAFRGQLELCARDVAGMIVALDAETAGNGSDPTLNQADEWSALCRAEWGILPWQYYPRWWLRKVGGCPTVRGPWWQSAFTSDPGPLICGYTRMAGWQYTSSAAVPGISGNVDANRWFGDLASLQATTIGGSEEDMPLNDTDKAEIRRIFAEEVGEGIVAALRAGFGGIHPGATNDTVRASQGWLYGKVATQDTRLAVIQSQVAALADRVEQLTLPAGVDPQAVVDRLVAEVHARTAPSPP